jgi:hypothetical protein
MRPTQADIPNQPRYSEPHSVLELRFATTGIAVANLRVAVTQQLQQDGQMRAVGCQRPGVVGVRRWFYRTYPHRAAAANSASYGGCSPYQG